MIESERFLLRRLRPEDATARYAAWFADPEVKQYITHRVSNDGILELRAYIEDKSSKENVLFLGIFSRQDGAHIGNIKYEPVDVEHHRAVLGILIGEPLWRGKGVAGEVIRASAVWLKKQRGISQIVLGVSRDHAGAIRAYEKIGFAPIASTDIPHNSSVSMLMEWRVSA